MNTIDRQLHSQEGSAVIVAIMILAILTLVGLSGAQVATNEVRIATNEKLHKISFFAAESARAYVMAQGNLFGASNLAAGTPHYFPNASDPYVADTVGNGAPFVLSGSTTFQGSVEYVGFSNPPRGSGFDPTHFRAHTYQMVCTGSETRGTETDIEAGFYRIGF